MKGFFDGASKGNPGLAGIGAYIIDNNGEIIWEFSGTVGKKTNNEAEYLALIALLQEVDKRDIQRITIYGDSQLVIYQAIGKWQIKQPHLSQLYLKVKQFMKGRQVLLEWIPREKNRRADELSNQSFKTKAPMMGIFSQEDLDKLTEHIFIAHGSHDYAVDTLHEACTCPAFKNYRRCKHLVAAMSMVKMATI